MASDNEPRRPSGPAGPGADADRLARDRARRELDALRNSRHSFVGLVGGRPSAALEAAERAAEDGNERRPVPVWVAGLLVVGGLFVPLLAFAFLFGVFADGFSGGLRYAAGAGAVGAIGALLIGLLAVLLLVISGPRWFFSTLWGWLRGS